MLAVPMFVPAVTGIGRGLGILAWAGAIAAAGAGVVLVYLASQLLPATGPDGMGLELSPIGLSERGMHRARSWRWTDFDRFLVLYPHRDTVALRYSLHYAGRRPPKAVRANDCTTAR
jgi:hypothetical protein